MRQRSPCPYWVLEWTAEVADLFEPALKARDGNAGIPDGPGWGVTISSEWLATANREVRERE